MSQLAITLAPFYETSLLLAFMLGELAQNCKSMMVLGCMCSPWICVMLMEECKRDTPVLLAVAPGTEVAPDWGIRELSMKCITIRIMVQQVLATDHKLLNFSDLIREVQRISVSGVFSHTWDIFSTSPQRLRGRMYKPDIKGDMSKAVSSGHGRTIVFMNLWHVWLPP